MPASLLVAQVGQSLPPSSEICQGNLVCGGGTGRQCMQLISSKKKPVKRKFKKPEESAYLGINIINNSIK
jgi:hypothetical protein